MCIRDSNATGQLANANNGLLGLLGNNRPVLRNSDGTVSTEETITVERGGSFFNVPTIVNGQRVDPAVVQTRFEQGDSSIPHVGQFSSLSEAVSAAQSRSNNLGRASLGQQNSSAPTNNFLQNLANVGFAGQNIPQPQFQQVGSLSSLQTDPTIQRGQALEAIAANTNNSVFGRQTNQNFFNDLRQEQIDFAQSDIDATEANNTLRQNAFNNAFRVDQQRVDLGQRGAVAVLQQQQREADALTKRLEEQRTAVLDQVRLNNQRGAFVDGAVGDLAYAMVQGDPVKQSTATVNYLLENGGVAQLGAGIASDLGAPIAQAGDVRVNTLQRLLPGGSDGITQTPSTAVVVNGKTFEEDPVGWLLEHPKIGGAYLARDDFFEAFPRGKKENTPSTSTNIRTQLKADPSKRREALSTLIERLMLRDIAQGEGDKIFSRDQLTEWQNQIQQLNGLTPDTVLSPQFLSPTSQSNLLNIQLGNQPNGRLQ